MVNSVTTRKGQVIENPSWVTKLLNHPLAGLIWLPIRVWLGWQWLEAGLHKVEGTGWMDGGSALKGFWTNIVKIPATGNPAIHYAWYRGFIQFLLNTQAYTWFAKLVAVGEVLVGVALILGIFTGFAALMGGVMNFNYMMAGSASTNPMLLVLAVFLIAAWKVSGYFGADFFLTRWVAALWNPRTGPVVTSPAGLPKGAQAR